MRNDELESILNRIHDWVRAADQKISILLAFQGLAISLAIPKLVQWFKDSAHASNVVAILFFGGSICVAIYSVTKSFHALIPSVSNDHVKKSITFFGDIASYSLKEYEDRVASITDEEVKADFVQQIHASSRISLIKHACFKVSVKFFGGSIILLVIGWFFLRFGIYVR